MSWKKVMSISYSTSSSRSVDFYGFDGLSTAGVLQSSVNGPDVHIMFERFDYVMLEFLEGQSELF